MLYLFSEITCSSLDKHPFVKIEYSSPKTTPDGYPLGTQANYTCQTTDSYGKPVGTQLRCTESDWIPKKWPVCCKLSTQKYTAYSACIDMFLSHIFLEKVKPIFFLLV